MSNELIKDYIKYNKYQLRNIVKSLINNKVIVLSLLTSLFIIITFKIPHTIPTKKTTYTLQVIEEVKLSSFNQIVIVKEKDIDGYIYLKKPKYPIVKYGDILSTSGTLQSIKDEGFYENYESYLISKKVIYSFKEIKSFKLLNDKNLLSYIGDLKVKFLSIFNESLQSEEAALINGILFGYKADFDEEFKDAMIVSGTSHIVAVSGFNVLILYKLMQFFKNLINIRILNLISIPILIFYLMLIGYTNLSAQRATIMLIIYLISQVLGRQLNIWTSFLFSVLIIIVEYPLHYKNISFILSLSAMLGLLLFYKTIKKILSKWGELLILDILSASLAISLATNLVLIRIFGSISLNSFISNLIILPLIPLLTIISIIQIIFNLFNLSYLNQPLKLLLQSNLNLIDKIIANIGKIQDGYIQVDLKLLVIFSIIIIILLNIYNFKNEKTIYNT